MAESLLKSRRCARTSNGILVMYLKLTKIDVRQGRGGASSDMLCVRPVMCVKESNFCQLGRQLFYGPGRQVALHAKTAGLCDPGRVLSAWTTVMKAWTAVVPDKSSVGRDGWSAARTAVLQPGQ